jgi:hypothetical protein
MLSGKQGRRELYCGGVREVGILLSVFVPLDIVVSRPTWSVPWLLVAVFTSFGAVIAGVELDPRSNAE